MRRLLIASMALLLVSAVAGAAGPINVRALSGSGNNLRNNDWGQAGTQYLRVANANYADGVSKSVGGPPVREISNRIFNDEGQNLFSENGVTQFGWTWGQFMDHDFGLRDERSLPAEHATIGFETKAQDPLEGFTNDFGAIDFFRTPAAPGTGVSAPRQHINTLSSFIDASNVYGVDNARDDWLRNPPGSKVDGNPANDQATLMLTPQGYLPRATARGNSATAPPMDLMGALTADKAAVAGDVRANENIALTAMHTLFAREHNRIVGLLAGQRLSQEEKFQIARRVVGGELQWITYNEFLPSLGVRLDRYRGYNPNVNPGISEEFAVVGYRAHSMIHGEFEPTVPAGTYTEDQLNRVFPSEGIEIEREADGSVTLVIPLVVAFGNPDLLEQVGEGPVLASLAAEPQYKNDEQIDNSLRSVLFQVPKAGTDPAACGTPVINPACFHGVVDLGAIDVERGRDHGMPYYNDLRRAYGLAPVRSFTDITGESTDRFPFSRQINNRNPIDDPDILDFVQLRDAEGNVIPLGSDEAGEDAVTGVRRSTLAARLRAIYGSVDKIDAFVGMVSEKHLPGVEMGPLQLAIWKKQFQNIRDGDRFYYQNDPALTAIERIFHITYRHTLSEIIKLNTGVSLPANVFKTSDADADVSAP
jgi:hypothetical protein